MESRQYVVSLINGEYAILTDTNTGEPITVAMALLPEEIEEGGIVLYENFTYIYVG
ncbi:MAG: DUF3006 domain-containing protein [Ruminococcus sp.]|nr:DUF3006 domain-containing protein [Ruminococcus sp.]